MTLGEKIKACRRDAKLSQEKVAELVGVSRQAVTKWEANLTAPNTENLFKLAEIFGTTVDGMLSAEGSPEQSPAEQLYERFKAEKAQKAQQRGARLKKRLGMWLLILGGYLVTYVLGRLICGDLAGSSFVGWLTGTDSKYYLFGWLTHQGVFWIAMAISSLPALIGKHRFSIVTFAAFVLGLLIGEWLGPNPAGAATGHTHYGWAIWGCVFFASIIAGTVLELLKKSNGNKC